MPLVLTLCNTSLPVIILGNAYTRANTPTLLLTVPTVCVHSVLYREVAPDLALRTNRNRQVHGVSITIFPSISVLPIPSQRLFYQLVCEDDLLFYYTTHKI